MFKNKKNLTSIFLVLIILLALFFRFKGLSTRDIWYDEALDVIQGQKSFWETTTHMAVPVHYYFVHFFLFFGRTTFILGLPSVLFGVASVYLLFLIGKKISNERIGLIAAFLMAISPMNIEFSQQILFYSYFVFFTLLALFFFIDFVLGVAQKKVRWKSFGFFFLFSFINFFVHISAPLVLLIQFIFLLFYLPVNYKVFKNYKKYLLWLIPPLLAIIYLLFFFKDSSKYLQIIQSNLKFNLQAPISLGFSLGQQLGPVVFKFNFPFFRAMFAWFGLGKGFRLVVYFLLFLVGFWSLIKKRKWTLLAFYLTWIILPFVFLYFVRLGHWFEEKYFIFIIPVYLLVIAEGIVFISRFLAKSLGQIIFLIFIFCLALNPIKIRTTYGFPVPGDYHYSPRTAYEYIRKNLTSGDKFFVPRGEGVFPEFYFDLNLKNKLWFEEGYVLSLNGKEYKKLTESQQNNYFVTINDFKDIFLSDATNYQFLKSVGLHNIFKFNFKKEDNLKLVPNEWGEWSYYDDFSRAKYLSQAADWLNLISTYAGKNSLPMTYGYYNLSPYAPIDAYILYHFHIPPTKIFFIKPLFFLDKGAVFKLLLIQNGKEMREIYQQTSQKFSYFNPLIKVDGDLVNEQEIFLKMEFIFNKEELKSLGNVGLKSFLIFSQIDNTRKDYQVTPDNKNVNYTYNASLEVVKSQKWLYQTLTNEGWVQSVEGRLFRLFGEPEKNPLIYEFKFPKPVTEFNLDLKTYVYINELDVYTDIDGQPSQLWQIKNDNEEKTHHLVIGSGKNFKIKFICQKEGTSCQLRGIGLNAKMVQ